MKNPTRRLFIAVVTTIDSDTVATVEPTYGNDVQLNIAGPGDPVAPITFHGRPDEIRRFLDTCTAQLDHLHPVDLDAEPAVEALA
jgi:hypothetical protein